MKHHMTQEQQKRFWEFVLMEDFQFYDTYIADLPEDAQIRFFEETPEFLCDSSNKFKKVDLKDDPIYQNIMKQINQMEKK